MGFQSFVAGVVIEVVTNDEVQASVEALFDKLITTRLLPAVPPMIGAAINQAADRLLDLNENGKPDVSEVIDAATKVLDQFIPAWLRPPG